MIQPSGQTNPFDVDRTGDLREEDQEVSAHGQKDEQGSLEQAQMSRAAWMRMVFLATHMSHVRKRCVVRAQLNVKMWCPVQLKVKTRSNVKNIQKQ